jgi:hypothetical protein
MADELAIPEESYVVKSKDCCSALVGSWYLEVFARSACKEDCKAGKLGNYDGELRDILFSNLCDDTHWDGLLVFLCWV